MSCSTSLSSVELHLDQNDLIQYFSLNKTHCGYKVEGDASFHAYCKNKNVNDILNLSIDTLYADLNITDEEAQFSIYIEWSACCSALAQYLNIDDDKFDRDRFQIESIDEAEEMTIIKGVLLPPKSLPDL